MSDEEEFSLWAALKEFFGFASQHPQLMGLSLVFLGWVIKQTRIPGRTEVRLIPEKKMFGSYGPPMAAHEETVIIAEIEGLDITIVDKGFNVPDPRAPIAGFLSQFIPAGPLRDFLLRGPGQLGYVDPSGSQWVGIRITLGDLLIMAGIAGLFGPSLAQFIPKL